MAEATADEKELAYYRSRIKEMLARVPPAVNSGSYDNAVAFKRAAAAAKSAAEKQRPNLMKVKGAYAALAMYY